MPPPEHPFNGRHTSYKINQDLTKSDDGVFDLRITPQGVFQSGTHTPKGGTPVNLTWSNVSSTEIGLEDADGNYWVGDLMTEVSNPRKQVTIGMYTVPRPLRAKSEGKRRRPFDQDNGIWVATKP